MYFYTQIGHSMFAPTLAAFRETLLCPEGRFRTLGTPRCECDVRGEPLLRAAVPWWSAPKAAAGAMP